MKSGLVEVVIGVVSGALATSALPCGRWRTGEWLLLTHEFVPLNPSALPTSPAVVHVAPLIVPVLLFPEESATVVPAPSANPYAATSPATVFGVVALATFEYGPRLPAASVARTR